jgi:Fe-S-cluster containining protein
MHVGTPPAGWPALANPANDLASCRKVAGAADYASWFAMPEAIRQELTAYYRAALTERTIPDRCDSGLPCLLFDEATRRCRVYEHRPEICREYEVGGEACLAARRDRGIDPA